MKKFKLMLLAIVSVILLSCTGKSNRKADQTMDKETMVLTDTTSKDQDGEFVKEAASGGLMEVQLGKYAEQNAQNPRVKTFGAMMVRDHTKANEELKIIADSKNLPLENTMEESERNKLSDLQEKTGADFDREYMKEMVDDHDKDIEKFKKQAEEGRDPDLKTFAIKTLPVLEAHADSAKSILDALR